ncbi:flavodoxin [Robertmurraya korlensis]|uniref:flavodoxin n=1 Tax=Robertmurraya korlensis TaxID=519977 RepID=UPI000826416D|nr:flavodoxin [Robertmurraya korlensis]
MKTFIGYVSMSGNTEDMANILKETLLQSGCEVDLLNLETVDVHALKDYDCIFLGAYTWGDGDLPYEVEEFFEELRHLNLEGVKAACFGSGDTLYPKFCMAVDIIETTLQEQGCDVYKDKLKIELSPESDKEVDECRQFAKSVYQWANKGEKLTYV